MAELAEQQRVYQIESNFGVTPNQVAIMLYNLLRKEGDPDPKLVIEQAGSWWHAYGSSEKDGCLLIAMNPNIIQQYSGYLTVKIDRPEAAKLPATNFEVSRDGIKTEQEMEEAVAVMRRVLSGKV